MIGSKIAQIKKLERGKRKLQTRLVDKKRANVLQTRTPRPPRAKKKVTPALLQKMTRRLVKEFDPEQVILFGSYAWGTPSKDSDVDLMVIVSESDETEYQRMVRALRALDGKTIATDVFVKTRAEFERYKYVHASFECLISENGKVLYDGRLELARSHTDPKGFRTTLPNDSRSASKPLGSLGAPRQSTDLLRGDAKNELVQNWFLKAERDLSVAKKLSADPDPILDTAIGYCPHAGESAVKGFLVLHDTRFGEPHNLPALIKLAIPHQACFDEWHTTAELLTDYATKYCGDDARTEPTKAEVETAIKAAEDLYNFVLSLVPPETHPLKPNSQ